MARFVIAFTISKHFPMKNQVASIFMALLGLVFLPPSPAGAQNSSTPVKKPLVVSLFNLGTQLPGSGVLGVFTTPVHPGLSVGTEFRYNHSLQNQFFQTAKLAVSYHQYVQTSVQLLSEAGYRRGIWRGTQAEFRLGAGDLHAFSGTEVFKAKDGVYAQKTNWGRPQFMASGTLGVGYQLPNGVNSPRFFLEYQFFLQMPFVKSYVPLAPNTALHVGVAIPMFQ